MRRQTLTIFLVFAAIHSALFLLLPLSFAEFNDRVNWFAINAIPWWPLYKFGLPVTRHGWLMTPNTLGWIWCGVVWAAFYYGLARIAGKYLSNYRAKQTYL
ncbi:MAG: hypothetical protein AMJ68_11275 [Acidithiobacillales bacterium SG8_45]|jgi:hypothetical protein|nr:MAG: hypothetical protein AMJ68_11275 [Acidithiobacillales bacterium SG8_45]